MVSLKKLANKVRVFWQRLGPGLITGASDDDPSGIATYAQAGAAFGISLLWTAVLTFPLMASVQQMCARIGLVTSEGLTGTLKRHYPRPLLYFVLLLSFPAIVINIGADIAGIGAVCNLLIPSISPVYFSIFFTFMLLAAIIYFPYKKIAAALKYLCIVLLVYLIVPFLFKQDWLAIAASSVLPTIVFSKQFVLMLVAIFGTTISPYLFFWQATMEAEEVKHRPHLLVVNKEVVDKMKRDVDFGMLFSNIVMFFIMLTTGTVLFNAGVNNIETVEQAAQALRPLAGQFAYLLFALGVIGTGMLAIPVLSGSLSYLFSETFGWKGSLDSTFNQARPFYIIIILSLLLGLLLNYVGISPIKALIYSAVLYGIISPVLIGVILHISNNKKIMGEYTNGKWSNFFGFAALILMSISVSVLIYLLCK